MTMMAAAKPARTHKRPARRPSASRLRNLSFEDHAGEVMRDLRETLSALIGSIPAGRAPGRVGGTGIRRATDLKNVLGINHKLAWQVYTVAHSVDPLLKVSHVPKPAAMDRFLEAAASHGAPSRLVKTAKRAFAEFGELVDVHAGNRSALDSMVSGVAGAENDEADLRQRRAAFKANSHIWGVQAATRLSTTIVHPSADEGFVDTVAIRGVVGLRRLRRETPFLVARRRIASVQGVDRSTVAIEPLDPRGDLGDGVSLLTKFCSRPLPQLRNYDDSPGYVASEILTNGIGNDGATTALLGDIRRRADSRWRTEENSRITLMAQVTSAFEVLIMDLLIFPGTFGPEPPVIEGLVYGNTQGKWPGQFRDSEILGNVAVTHIGQGPGVVESADVPRYSALLEYAFDRAGWDGRKFDVYRCRVEYPVMPSWVFVQFDLPEKPT